MIEVTGAEVADADADAGDVDAGDVDAAGGVPVVGAAGALPADRRVRRRRRGRALEEAIFATVVDLLRVHGYGGLTMEGVAIAAGTGKAALYRRWHDRSALVVDALDYLLTSPEDLPDQGGLRGDLIALLQDKAVMLNSPVGQALQSLLPEIEHDRAFFRLIDERVFAPRRDMFEEILERGRRRGEVRAGSLSPLVAEVGPALLIKQFLATDAGIAPEYVAEIVDGVLLPLLRGVG